MRYNILQIISDQHIADAMGCAGHAQAITPHMDRLAATGTRFTRAYTQNPICTPSRVSILSGQYCHNHGYYGLGGPRPKRLPHFLGHFKANGYRTAAIGKLHLPNDPENWLAGGCDLIIDNMHGTQAAREHDEYLASVGFPGEADHGKIPELPGSQQHEARASKMPFEHSAEGWAVQKAIEFIDREDDQPFCMQVSFHRPHQCYTPDQRFWDLYDDDLDLPFGAFDADNAARPPHFQNSARHGRSMEGLIDPKDPVSRMRRVWRGYLACITHCDYGIGLLMDHLERWGLADRTIVIYHSDHGAYSGMFGVPEKAPGICSEQVCRVPMIWHVPGMAPSDDVDHFIENIDLGPTIASLCGLEPMDAADGKDISALIRGEDAPVRDQALTEHPWSRSIRFGPWRYVHYPRGMFQESWDVGELYNIEEDPFETTNLYDDPDHEPVLREARHRLIDFLIQTNRVTTAHIVDGPPAGDGRRLVPTDAAGHPTMHSLNYL